MMNGDDDLMMAAWDDDILKEIGFFFDGEKEAAQQDLQSEQERCCDDKNMSTSNEWIPSLTDGDWTSQHAENVSLPIQQEKGIQNPGSVRNEKIPGLVPHLSSKKVHVEDIYQDVDPIDDSFSFMESLRSDKAIGKLIDTLTEPRPNKCSQCEIAQDDSTVDLNIKKVSKEKSYEKRGKDPYSGRLVKLCPYLVELYMFHQTTCNWCKKFSSKKHKKFCTKIKREEKTHRQSGCTDCHRISEMTTSM